MAGISKTLAGLAANRMPPVANGTRLQALVPTTHNPGALAAWMYLPTNLPRGAPLVVVLHGCTQDAAGYDAGSGWSALADRAGFALLFPEQRRGNNMNLCFNWFQSEDIVRHGGEAESIAHLTEQMIAAHDLDRNRIFVTGLSAGGAMTAAILATYPDLFAGGAIIGGLPYGGASGVSQAMERMAGRFAGDDGVDTVKQAFPDHVGRRPSVSIWHGTADATVAVANLDRLAMQWRGVHGMGKAPTSTEDGATWERSIWAADDRILVETWRIANMGHGVPIDPSGPARLGQTGPYMLAAGIDSTAAIARSWGIAPATAGAKVAATAPIHTAVPTAARAAAKPAPAAINRPTRKPAASRPPAPARAKPSGGIQGVIEDALRAAGLMK